MGVGEGEGDEEEKFCRLLREKEREREGEMNETNKQQEIEKEEKEEMGYSECVRQMPRYCSIRQGIRLQNEVLYSQSEMKESSPTEGTSSERERESLPCSE